MLVLLSPAKNLDWATPPVDAPRTQPAFMKETAALARLAKALSAAELKRLMDLSDKLAALNAARFQAFDPKAAPEAGKQAVLAFNGDVYQGLAAKTLTAADLAWAQDHVRILSGLYGLLRPLDAIQPYRLEMGTKLSGKHGEDLYDFWGDRLAKALDADIQAMGAGVIVNLASEEYFSAIAPKALKTPVITPTFKEIKAGQARAIFMFVKRARGRMARFIIENRITDPQALKEFNLDGYRFDPAASSAHAWTFSRPQPPAKTPPARSPD